MPILYETAQNHPIYQFIRVYLRLSAVKYSKNLILYNFKTPFKI
jgi:hypothetical protein